MGTKVEYAYFLDEKEEDRLRASFSKEKRRVTALKIQYETLLNDLWKAVVRYDTAHNNKYPYGHKDTLHPSSQKARKTDLRDFGIRTINDAFTYAEQDLKNNWKKYKKRYLNWLKTHDKK